jgi:hypothetical protein
MDYQCDYCSKKMKYGEVYVAYLDIDGGRLNFCLDCTDSKDDAEREGVKWSVLENGKSDVEYKTY